MEWEDVEAVVIFIFFGIVVVAVIAFPHYFPKIQGHAAENATANITYAQYVCTHLEQKINGSYKVYPAVFEQKRYIENYFQARVPNLYGDRNKARQWDEQGVMCDIPIEMCDWDLNYCMDLTMIVPVNFSQYETWNGG